MQRSSNGDDGNEEHLAQHGVSPYDVEQVFRNDPTWRRNKGGRAAQYVMDGRTDAGRTLRVLVLWADDAERVLCGHCVGSIGQVTPCHV